MESFVTSIQPAAHYSTSITNHHRLFQVFHNVALRYTALKSSLVPSQQDQMELKAQMDQYLSTIGAYPPCNTIEQRVDRGAQYASVTPFEMPPDDIGPNEAIDQASQLATWFSSSQQMMGWLDSDQFQL